MLLDQWSKRMVRLHFAGRCVSWGPLFQVRCVTHPKNLYRTQSARAMLVLMWFMALFSAIALYRSGMWFQSGAAVFGLGLTFGGAAGNLWDILRRGFVVDFVDFRWWPVFSLADVAIVGGLALAFWQQI